MKTESLISSRPSPHLVKWVTFPFKSSFENRSPSEDEVVAGFSRTNLPVPVSANKISISPLSLSIGEPSSFIPALFPIIMIIFSGGARNFYLDIVTQQKSLSNSVEPKEASRSVTMRVLDATLQENSTVRFLYIFLH